MGLNYRFTSMKTIISYLLLIFLTVGLIGCSQLKIDDLTSTDIQTKGLKMVSAKLSESAPPKVIRELSQNFQRSPKVEIISPQADKTFNTTSINVQLKVKDLALFKDKQLGLGPHLHLILDNEPYQAVYNTEEPIVLTDLTPGTHTLRVFASRPWHESFKNEGAYAQTSFNIFTKTEDNNIDPQLPLLTYSRPTGTYTAEPIMLDFYLTNVDSQVSPQDRDWRIRVTINGESFILDQWQPVYLTGFVPGNNWVQLELIDKNGNNIDNAFNNIVRLINYQPNAEDRDTLAKLVTEQISVATAYPIIEQNYYLQPAKEPEIIEPELTAPSEAIKPQAEPTIVPEKTTVEPESIIEEEKPTDLSASTETSDNLTQPAVDNDNEGNTSESIETVPEKEEIEQPTSEGNQTTDKSTSSVNESEEAIALSVKTKPNSSVVVEVKPSDSESVSVKITEDTKDRETVKETAAERAIALESEVETTEIAPISQPQESKLKLPAWIEDFSAKLQQIIQDFNRFLSELVNKNNTID